jgi:CBS domain-containing protein
MSIQAILYDKGSNVVTIAPGASLKSAAEKLRDKNIAALVVVQSDGAILGLISEREIVHALAGTGERTCGLPVSQVMSREIVTVAPQDSLKRAMALMTRHRTRHLLVLRDGEPAGIVSIGDVIKHRLEDLELTVSLRGDVYATAH